MFKGFNFKVIFTISIIVVLLTGCKTTQQKSLEFDCKYQEHPNNLGGNINTKGNEVAPMLFNSYVYYMIKPKDAKLGEYLYRIPLSELRKGKDAESEEVTDFKFKDLTNISTPGFYYDVDSNIVTIFSAIDKKDKLKNKNFYKSILKDGSWSKPLLVKELSGKGFEGQITFSKDSKYAILSAERADSIGGIDLYYTTYNSDDSWAKPINLGTTINSKLDENFPVLIGSSLYFASKNGSSKNDFNIFKSEIKDGNFSNPIMLLADLNTDNEEHGFYIDELNSYLIASNRLGGCGSTDLYLFDKCNNSSLEGTVMNIDNQLIKSGKVVLEDNQGSKREIILENNSTFNFELKYGTSYYLSYYDECNRLITKSKEIIPQCEENKVIKNQINLIVPRMHEFTFESYNVPFFLSGYYLPITKNNLDAIKLKFEYNLLGNNDSTKYIEYPNDSYYQYSQTVEDALLDAKNFIKKEFESLSEECSKKFSYINVKVSGYADERKFGEKAIYDGPTIVSVEQDVNIRQSSAMTNELISILRAYYTADELKKLLTNDLSSEVLNKIRFEVKGQGIDAGSKNLELKRRVDISISLIE